MENQRDLYYAAWPGAIINPHWLELPMCRTNFHGPKGVWAIEVRLYKFFILCTHYEHNEDVDMGLLTTALANKSK